MSKATLIAVILLGVKPQGAVGEALVAAAQRAKS